MNFEVLSRLKVQEFRTNEEHIVISVNSPKEDKAQLPEQASRLNAMFLEFHDIDERCLDITKRKNCNVCGGSGYIEKWRHIEDGRCFKCNREGLNLTLFTKEDAKAILRFVIPYSAKIGLIVVNCEAGISRSSAIAGALSKIMNGDDEYYFKHYCPNSLVHRLILEACYVI